jgi:hypothetical protein
MHRKLQERAEDPYAMYGGYQNYVALRYQAKQQQQQQQPLEQKLPIPWRCDSCNGTKTQKPRRGPEGPGKLCNACRLHYMKLLRKMGLSKNAASTRSNRELNNLDASKLARKRRKFNLNAAIDEDFLGHGRWEPVESARNDEFGGAAPSLELERRNSPWSTSILKRDHATDTVIQSQVPSPRSDSHGPGIHTTSASTASRQISTSFPQQLEAPIVANAIAAMFSSASPSAYPTQPVGTLAGTQYMGPTVQDHFLADTSGPGTPRKFYDPDSDWLQLKDVSEAADQYRTMPWAQPIQRAPVGDARKGHELQREWSDGLSAAPWQHIPSRLDPSMLHGPSDEPYQTPSYHGAPGLSYQSQPAKILHERTDNTAVNYQNSDSRSNQSTSHDSSRSFSPVEFFPGPQESILSRIDTPALNTTVDWSTPGEKITASHFSDTSPSSEAQHKNFPSWSWAGWVDPTRVTFPFQDYENMIYAHELRYS